MAYCTLQNLIDQYGVVLLREATDRGDIATGEIDTVAVERTIADADAVIDGYLKVRYALPLAATPNLVNRLSVRIAVYGLHANVVGEKIRRDYEDTLKILAQISRGELKLDIAGAEPASSGASGVRITDRDRPFTADNLKVY